MTDLPAILRAPLLADLLGLTVHSVNEMLRRGEVPASKIAGRWIVRRETFLAFLERQERANRAPPASVEDRAARLLRALPLPRRAPRPHRHQESPCTPTQK